MSQFTTPGRDASHAGPSPLPSPDQQLRLMAFDAEDLAVLSAHLQDAVVKVADFAYVPERRRFAMVARRFDWTCCDRDLRRCLSGLSFEGVLRARTRGFDLADTYKVLSLLAVHFAEKEAPSGIATLVFAGGAEIELELECLEARMRDLGPAWSTKSQPAHDLGQD